MNYRVNDINPILSFKSTLLQSIGIVISLDFNSEGTRIGLIDYTGTVVISNVDTGECVRELISTVANCKHGLIDLVSSFLSSGQRSKCRWNPIMGSSMIAFKYARRRLVLVDLEKAERVLEDTLVLKDGIK